MRSRLGLLALLLGFCGLVAFGGSLASGFHFDDYAIFSDASIRSPHGWLEIWSVRQTRPLTYLTFWFNFQLGGDNPLGYHALNLALHIGAVLLLWDCLRRLMPLGHATFAAAVFVVHPLQAEAVDYVWGRSIVLAALLCFAAWREWIKENPWRAVLWFAAALLAKEEVAAFPLVLLALDRKKRGPIAVMLAMSAAAAARIVYATSVTPGAVAGIQAGISPWRYFLAEGPVLWRYARLFVAPWGFTVDPEITVPPVWLGLAAWAIMIGAAVWLWRRKVWLALPLIVLLPSSSLFPASDLAADRRMYLAIGVLGLLCAALPRVKAPWPHLMIAALAAVSVARTEVWRSDERLWREAVERAPEKARPLIQLARNVSAPEALGLLEQARQLAPNDPSVASEAGKVLLSQGRAADALAQFGRALALDPKDARNYNNRGVALAVLGQAEAARADFERALQMEPSLDEARANLAKLK
jgi:hypothetical protein